MTVVLDTGVLRLLLTPRGVSTAVQCQQWYFSLLRSGATLVLPEIVDYEERRTLIHRQRTEHLVRLEQLRNHNLYLPITTSTMHRAAELWAEARRIGRKTADDKALDIDMILCAQVQMLEDRAPDEPAVATTNVAHLAPFVNALRWSDIEPGE